MKKLWKNMKSEKMKRAGLGRDGLMFAAANPRRVVAGPLAFALPGSRGPLLKGTHARGLRMPPRRGDTNQPRRPRTPQRLCAPRRRRRRRPTTTTESEKGVRNVQGFNWQAYRFVDFSSCLERRPREEPRIESDNGVRHA